MSPNTTALILTAIAVAFAEPVAAEPVEQSSLESAIEEGAFPKTTAVLIESDDGLLYERYFGDGDLERLNDTRSATKTLVAMAVGKAIEQGHVESVDENIWPLFANLRVPASYPEMADITFRDLLTMTSSLHCDDNNDTPGNEERMYPHDVWTDFALTLPKQPGWVREEDGLGSWRYCTAGSFLLGQALQRATGVPVDSYIEREILQPAGITRQRWDRSPSGEVQTGGGLELTARALSRLALMMSNNGRVNGFQLLPEQWVEETTTRRRDTFLGMGYGYQMWVKPYQTPCGIVEAWFMAGNGGNHILSLKDHGIAITITRENYNTGRMHFETMEMVEQHILPALICS